MAQQNIDFGSFPNDPSADAIRTALQKTQENFTELYVLQNSTGVASINSTKQPGITVSGSTGNVLLSADFSKLNISTTTLQVGLSPNSLGYQTSVNNATQTLYVDLRPNTVFSNLTASNFVFASVGAGISAAGTTQGTATILTKQFNQISTVVNGANSVRLPTAVAGMSVIIANPTANTLNVFPDTNGIINNLSANASYSHTSGTNHEFIAISTTQWYVI
jgi:hypothetical protein